MYATIGQSFRSVLSAVILIATGCAVCFSQEEKVVSPFVKPSAAVVEQVAVATPLDALEFNGVVVIGGKTHVSLLDTKSNKSYWLSENETADDGLEIVRIDKSPDSTESVIQVHRGAATKELSMRKFDIITAAAPVKALATNAVAAPANKPTATATNGSIQTASDDEVRERMKRVAEEIRRRRANRRSISNQTQSRATD